MPGSSKKKQKGAGSKETASEPEKKKAKKNKAKEEKRKYHKPVVSPDRFKTKTTAHSQSLAAPRMAWRKTNEVFSTLTRGGYEIVECRNRDNRNVDGYTDTMQKIIIGQAVDKHGRVANLGLLGYASCMDRRTGAVLRQNGDPNAFPLRGYILGEINADIMSKVSPEKVNEVNKARLERLIEWTKVSSALSRLSCAFVLSMLIKFALFRRSSVTNRLHSASNRTRLMGRWKSL